MQYHQTNVPSGLTNVVMVASGDYHTLALQRDGTVVAWGNNAAGETNVPPTLTNAVMVAGGDSFSLALRNDGTVAAWGQNDFGQTNVPASLTNAVALAGGNRHAVALRADGTVIAWGKNNYGQTNVPPGLTNIIAVAAGGFHSLALTGDGRVVLWGGADAETNMPAGLNNVVAIAGSVPVCNPHSQALRADGTVSTWGWFGEAIPTSITNVTAMACGPFEDVAIRADGTLVGAGTLGMPVGVSNVVGIACGYWHCVALVGDGAPFITSALVPRAIVAGQTARLRASATGAWPLAYQWRCFGTNLPGATNAILTLNNVAPAQAGTYSVEVSNALGSALSPDIPVQVLPALVTVQPQSQTALLEATVRLTVSAIGPPQLNYQWQFNGTNLPGATTSSLLFPNVQLNQAGSYSVTVSSVFGTITSDSAQLDLTQLAAWGDNRYDQASRPPGMTNVAAIASGWYHNLALKADSTVVAWGNNWRQQSSVPAGLSNVVAIAGGVVHSLALKADGTVLGWGYNDSGQTDPPPDLTNVVAVAGGDWHSLALKADGTVVAWGDNSYGQTNIPSELGNVVGIAAGNHHNLAVRADGGVVAWGWGYYGQCTVPPDLAGVVAVAAGERHSLALKADGTVVTWGGWIQNIVPPALSNVVAIAASGDDSGALKADGTVVVWGANTRGQTNTPPDLVHVSALSLGYQHSLAMVGQRPRVLTGLLTNQTANYYSTVILQVAATGTGPLTYQWRFYGTNLPGATDATLVLSSLMPSQAGAYSVVVRNPFGAAESSNAVLTAVPATEIRPMSQSSYVGGTVSLSTAALGPSQLTYQWQFNGADLPGATSSTLVLTNVQVRQAGPYAVAVNGPAGIVQSANAAILVTEAAVWGLDSQTNVPGDLTNVVAIAGGVSHTLALRADGTVVGWQFGDHDFGQAFAPVGLSNVVGIAAGEYHSLALKADGTVTGWGFDKYEQTVAPLDLTNAVAIAAGQGHSLTLRADGTVVAWGYDGYGQTDVPAGLSNVVGIAAAANLTLVVTDDGAVSAWGGYSQPVVPPVVTNVVSVAAGADHFLALRRDGTVVDWTPDGTIQSDTPPGLTNVVMIAAGTGHNLAVTAGGTVIAWPDTNIPLGVANVTMIAAGYSHSMAVVKGVSPALRPPLAATAWGPGGLGFSVPTQSGRVYRPEYKSQLTDTNWTPLPLTYGSGGPLRLTFPANASPQGFFRVRRW